jgi:hypothetical protein
MKRAFGVLAAAAAASAAFADLVDGQQRLRVQVAGHMARDALADLVDHRHGRTDLPRGTVAALEAVVLDERRLHRMQLVGRAHAFDGGDLGAVVHDREAQAGIDAAAVDQHRAGAALALVAALLGAGQVQVFAQRVEERGAGVERQLARLAIYAQGDLAGHRRRRLGRADGALACSLGPGQRQGRRRRAERAADQDTAPGLVDIGGVVHQGCFLLSAVKKSG